MNDERLDKLSRDLSDGIERIHARMSKFETAMDKAEVTRKKANTFAVSSANGYIPSTEEEKAFSTFVRQGDGRMDAYEKKTLVLSNDPQAGYLAPDGFIAEIMLKLQEYSPVRKVAGIRQTDATAVQVPKQTGVVDAGWTSEIGTRIADANLSFGLETITTHEMYCLVKVGRQMLEDSRVNLDQFIQGEAARKLANIEGLSFLTGNTTGQPEGLLVNANIGSSNSGNGTNLTADGMIDLVYSLPQEYRRNGAFLMARSTIQEVRKLKSANSLEYIWQPSFAAGQPETLLGYPIFECCDMPAVANAAFPVLFGDFKRGYLIVDRIQLEVSRLIERWAELAMIGYHARKRVGGQVVLAEAIRKLLIAT